MLGKRIPELILTSQLVSRRVWKDRGLDGETRTCKLSKPEMANNKI